MFRLAQAKLTLFVLLMSLISPNLLNAQPVSSGQQGTTTGRQIIERLDENEKRLVGIEKDIGDIKKNINGGANASSPVSTDNVAAIKRKLEDFERDVSILKIIIVALTALAVLFAVTKYIYDLVSSRAASKATAAREEENRKMLETLHGGEVAAQKRAQEQHDVMIEAGRKTMNLVNDTLQLAKRASEYAVNALERRVRMLFGELDKETAKLFVKFANRDNRDIVNKLEHRDELRKLLSKLEEFEHSNALLEEPIPLSPNCEFLKALQYYLEVQFDLTIETLQNIINRQDVTMDLRIRCYFWIGYEQNNIGNFEAAEQNFRSAIDLANGASQENRALLLERLLIETMLFDTRRYRASDLINDVDRLIKDYQSIDFGEDEGLNLIHLTKGNILYASAMESYNNGEAEEARNYLRQAIEVWLPLVEIGREEAIREYAFACLALEEDVDGARTLLKDKVTGWAEQQVRDRIGARHKAFHSVTLLMIAIAFNDEDLITSLDWGIQRLIGEVHPRALIYSPLRKRNVSRKDFASDVKSIQRAGLPNIA